MKSKLDYLRPSIKGVILSPKVGKLMQASIKSSMLDDMNTGNKTGAQWVWGDEE